MRNTVAAVAALILVACAVEKTPPKERLTFEKIERTFEHTVAVSKPVRAAEGHVFVIVHLIEDPAREEDRDWIRSVMEDWDGQKYQAQYSGVINSQSGSTGLFGRKRMTVHPDRIRIVFEVPQTATLRNVTVPDPIALYPANPVRFPDRTSPLRIVRRVEPYYPESARRYGVDGLVKLEVLVAADGTVAGARHIHGPRILGDAAAAAVRQWKYEPLVVDGKAVPALVQEHINFRLGSQH